MGVSPCETAITKARSLIQQLDTALHCKKKKNVFKFTDCKLWFSYYIWWCILFLSEKEQVILWVKKKTWIGIPRIHWDISHL